MKIRKWISLLLVVVVCIGSFSMTANASDFVHEGESGTTVTYSEKGIVRVEQNRINTVNGLNTWRSRARWNYTASVVHGISFYGTRGDVTVSYTAGGGDYTAKVYYQVQKKVNGRWSTVYTSSTKSGVFSVYMSGSHNLGYGTFRVCTVGNVYNANNRWLEKVVSYSNEYYCY